MKRLCYNLNGGSVLSPSTRKAGKGRRYQQKEWRIHMQETLGKVIKFKRIEMDKSQRELAQAASVSNSTISRIEHEEPFVPDNTTLKSIADFLHLDYFYFLALNNQIPDEPEMRVLRRAAERMNEDEKSRMMQIIRLAFPDIFRNLSNDKGEIDSPAAT